jgi:hypothetical protein
MKHNIGSRQAENMARKKFGDRAAVQRSGKHFRVGVVVDLGIFYAFNVKGSGKSWAQALTAAGIELPTDKPLPETPSMDADMERGEVEE